MRLPECALHAKTASEQHVATASGRADAVALFDRCSVHLHRLREARSRLPENEPVPRAANQFFRGPGQAIFANCQRTGQAFSARSFKTYDVPPLVSRFRASGDVLSRSFLCNLFLLCGANA